MNESISLLAQQIFFYCILTSIITFGLTQTIKSLLAKPSQDINDVVISKWVGVGITYGIGILFAFVIGNNGWVKNLTFGLAIGSCSVAAYKAVIQSFLNLIPSTFDKIFNSKKDDTKNV